MLTQSAKYSILTIIVVLNKKGKSMAKRRIRNLVDVRVGIPRAIHNEILEVKKILVNPTGRSVSANQALCFCLKEYFEMKKAQKKEVVS
jgi:hypothetical protein